MRVSQGGRRDALAINPQTAVRLRAYLEASGHAANVDGPLFRRSTPTASAPTNVGP
jgi:hypothetical protein